MATDRKLEALLKGISLETLNAAGDPLRCSFCEKSHHEVPKLIAGPGVFICNECIELCVEILADETAAPS